MGLYGKWVLPRLTHLSMRQQNLTTYRQRVVPSAEGRVLEIGVGSGLNLSCYTSEAEQVIALDPSSELLRMARDLASQTERQIEFMEASAETIPLPDQSIDSVVMTGHSVPYPMLSPPWRRCGVF